ncbi:Clavaminate synthase-like protein [Lophiostoma macrostomum CBS 122681]|uniref:Clavaminate synthase-like protein n=1 Tax=Lophiostoma macrostomum CBS 122681 TaxID=1314788 RepID=A0A6A6TKG0_9PLEO|nr:Clavaminate synthase-like protein [Lophiostoma macrostomum CBS 122681]
MALALADTPTLDEIIQLTRRGLTAAEDNDIRSCGSPALSLLRHDPNLCLRFAYQKLHDVPYQEVKSCWRRLYTDAAVWETLRLLEEQKAYGMRGQDTKIERDDISKDRAHVKGQGTADNRQDRDDWVTEVVKILDMALILTGAPSREWLIELILSALQGMLARIESVREQDELAGEPPTKRRRITPQGNASQKQNRIPEEFPTKIVSSPILHFPIERQANISLTKFQSWISNRSTQKPLIITDTIDHWPALSERSWDSPSYLLSQTLNGRRLVPIEIGRTYTSANWTQKILSFGEFMESYLLKSPPEPTPSSASIDYDDELDGAAQTGYLAQHDLFAQIPALRSDIAIPDYCYAEPPPAASNPPNVKPVPKLETPLLNAWFGPANTISPLHTDPYHNILAQVVGSKYVRLYSHKETKKQYPRGVEDGGVDMSNTSEVDLDDAFKLFPGISPWPQESGISREGRRPLEDGMWEETDEEEEKQRDLQRVRGEFEAHFPMFKDAEYVDCVLKPGDCLYIPVGWWHYVRSLTPSFSVSFWFN